MYNNISENKPEAISHFMHQSPYIKAILTLNKTYIVFDNLIMFSSAVFEQETVYVLIVKCQDQCFMSCHAALMASFLTNPRYIDHAFGSSLALVGWGMCTHLCAIKHLMAFDIINHIFFWISLEDWVWAACCCANLPPFSRFVSSHW